MRKSELILPIRIYDDLYEQRRFNKICDDDGCDQEIIVASNELPFFQFTRDSSLQVATQLLLRNVCADKQAGFYKLLSENESNFTPGPDPSGLIWNASKSYVLTGPPPEGRVFTIFQYGDCGGLSNGDLTDLGDLSGVTPVSSDQANIQLQGFIPSFANKYRVKLVVDKFIQTGGSSFQINVYNGDPGGTVIDTITAPGVYVWEFFALAGHITIEFADVQFGDEWVLSSIQGTHLAPNLFNGYTTDKSIDETKVKITQLADGRDLVVYCEPSNNYHPEPGVYYYILQMGLEMYFSETFTVKRPQDLEKYYCLEWTNVNDGNGLCDINNAIALSSALTGCTYTNKIYLEASLIAPQYETSEDEETNGEGEKNSTFRRWQKTLIFNLAKCPPFLTDALSGIFMFNYVGVSEPLNDKQDVRSDAIAVEKVTAEVSDVLQNCFQNVKLNLILPDTYNRTNCCDAMETYDCPDSFSAPTLFAAGEIGSTGVYQITGTAVPGSLVVVEYNSDGDGWVQDANSSALVDSLGNYSVLFDSAPIIAGVSTSLFLRVNNKTFLCDFGTTADQQVIP
jgi:hypothetical protein